MSVLCINYACLVPEEVSRGCGVPWNWMTDGCTLPLWPCSTRARVSLAAKLHLEPLVSFFSAN